MLAAQFCNLSPGDAALLLARGRIVGQAARIKVAFDWQQLADKAKGLGNSLTGLVPSVGDAGVWPIAAPALLGAGAGGVLGGLAGHNRRRRSAITGALLGALTGGGLGAAYHYGLKGTQNTSQTLQQEADAARSAVNRSSASPSGAVLPEEAAAVAGGVMPSAPPEPGTVRDPAFLKSLLGDRVGGSAYAAVTGHVPPELIRNNSAAGLGAIVGGGLAQGGTMLGKQLHNRATLPQQLKAVPGSVLDSVYKVPKPAKGEIGRNIQQEIQKLPDGSFWRHRKSPLVAGYSDSLAREAINAHRRASMSKDILSRSGRGIKGILPGLAGAAIGALLGGQAPPDTQ